MGTANAEVKYSIATYLGGFLEDWRHSMATSDNACDERRNAINARVARFARLATRPERIAALPAEIDLVVAGMLSELDRIITIFDVQSDPAEAQGQAQEHHYSPNPAWVSTRNHDAEQAGAPDPAAPTAPAQGASPPAKPTDGASAIDKTLQLEVAAIKAQLDKQVKAEVKRCVAARHSQLKSELERSFEERLSQLKTELERSFDERCTHLEHRFETRLKHWQHQAEHPTAPQVVLEEVITEEIVTKEVVMQEVVAQAGPHPRHGGPRKGRAK